MFKFVCASIVCLGLALTGFSNDAAAGRTDPEAPGTIIHWVIINGSGNVGGAGWCWMWELDLGCAPEGALKSPDDPNDPCFANPGTDGCAAGPANRNTSSSPRRNNGRR